MNIFKRVKTLEYNENRLRNIIDILERQVFELKNPAKFKVGEKVLVTSDVTTYNNVRDECIVVDFRLTRNIYNSETYRFYRLYTLFNLRQNRILQEIDESFINV